MPIEGNLTVQNRGDFIGPIYLGSSGNQTGLINFWNSSSYFMTSFQAGNATVDLTYTFPTAGPAANNYGLVSSTTGTLSWLNLSGTYAPIASAYVTIGNDATLTSERSLTGTSNQIIVTDNGAGSTVVLSTPQNINSGASPTFAGLTLTSFSGAISASSGVLAAGTLSIANGGTAVTSLSNIVGTANQVTVTNGTARVIGGNVTLSLPQDINTSSSPTFVGGTFTGTLDGQGQLKGKGTATNDSPSAGYIGEYIESNITTATNVPTSTQYGDLTSISLTAGDWDVSADIRFYLNGATCTEVSGGIKTTSGNSAPVEPAFGGSGPPPTSAYSSAIHVSSAQFLLASTTTIYLKYEATYPAGTPQARGIIRARRSR